MITVDSKPGSDQYEGLKRDRTASVVIKGHAYVQNIRRGHYELGTEATQHARLIKALDELAQAI